jgi:cytochrome b pre-mRNA-processing protein 3
MKDMANRYSISAQQHRIKLATNLFRAAQYQASSPQWYGNSKIQSDFRPQHAMLSMHIWFIHRRLLAYDTPEDKESGKHGYNLMLQEELFDIFWNDTRSRIRSSGVHELTVTKHLKDAQQATFLQCTQYDHAFQEFGDDRVKRFEVICDAVWRHVLGGIDADDAAAGTGTEGDDEEKGDAVLSHSDARVDDDVLIRKIGAYVEYQMENVVYKLPDDYFDEGRIGWGNIPDLSALGHAKASNADGNVDGDDVGNVDGAIKTSDDSDQESPEVTTNALRGMTFFKNNWVQVLTDAGEPYYWNEETNMVSWQKPM